MKEKQQQKPMPIKQNSAETQEARGELYPLKIPEAQGDLADRAEVEIEQEIEELIWRVQQQLRRGDDGKNTH